MGKGKKRAGVGPLEALEARRLLSTVSLSSGVLKLTGNSSSSNTLNVWLSGSSTLVAVHNGVAKSYSAGSVSRIEIVGGSAGDNIWLTDEITKPSILRGNDGNDTISGGSGKDTIYGGSGNDKIYGNNGDDAGYGEDGNDSLYGGAGTDALDGGSGDNLKVDDAAPAPEPEQPKPAPVGVTDFALVNFDKSTGKATFKYTYNPAGGTYLLLRNGASTGVTDTNGDVSVSHTGTATYQMRDANGLLSNSVNVTDGAATQPPPDDGAVPNDDSATAPKPVITARQTSVMAGQSIFVHAIASSLGSGSPQNALYKWDFGDDGSSYDNLNGFNAAHFYDDPGSYTIRLTITNQAGKSNSTSITVNVASNTRKKIYVSSSGSDSNPGTQDKPIKSFSKAASLVTHNTEILFRRGDTFDAAVNMDIDEDNVVIGAYGSGNRPVIRWTPNVSGYPTVISPRGDNITVQDLTFTSSASNKPQAIRASGNNVTVRNNQFLDLGYAINANAKPDGLLVEGNTAPNVGGIKSYFVWGEGTDHVYLGNTVANSREEHVIRVVGADRVLVWDNDLTNTTGQVSGDDTPKGALTLHKGSYYWIAKNDLNKGPVGIGPLGNGDGLGDKGARFRYGVFDGNVFDTKVSIDHGAERIMFRNNVIKSTDSAILIEGYNSTYGRTVSDVVIANNTVINSSSSGRFVKVEKDASGIVLTNNLYVAPNLTTGQGATASVYVEDSDMNAFKFVGNNVWANAKTLEYAQGGQNYVWASWSNSSGYKTPSEWNALGPVGTDVFSDVSISGYTPTSSGTVNDTGSSYMGIFHDLNGKTRSSWTAGAIEL